MAVSPEVNVATGSTLTLSGFTAKIVSITVDGSERGVIDTTHLGTTTARTFIPSDLYDPGSATLTVHFNPDDNATWILEQAVDTGVEIGFPEANGAKVAGSAFCNAYGYELVSEEKMEATVTLKFTGALTWTAGS